MRRHAKAALAGLVSLCFALPDLAYPQAAGPGVGAPGGQGGQAGPAAAPSSPGTSTADNSSGGSPIIVYTDLNWLLTNRISKDFNAAVTECGRYDDVYRIDCLRQNMQRIAASLPDDGDYGKVKRILSDAAGRLGRIVDKYADPKAPRLTPPPGANPRFRQNRSYKAVRRNKLRQAMTEAAQVVQEAATQLLRSSENSTARLAHYQSISVAVGSTKVLLRSL
ncbi:MAG TPA: hypothetical protein VN112_07135 [Ensifer sp.]|nr:hypothetical protein [Ensifer sp.]